MDHELPVRPGADQVVAQAADDGRPGWLHLQTGRWVPLISGAEDPPADGGDGGTGGSGDTPPAGDPGPDPGGQEPEPAGELDAEAAKRLAQERGREAAKYRNRAKELEAELKKRDDAQKTEAERLRDQAVESQKERDRLEAELKTIRTTSAIERAATKKGFRDPTDAVRLVNLDDLETDADGAVLEASIGSALAQIAKDKPYLLGGTGGSPTNPASDKGNLTWDDVQKMTPAQINDNWDDVQKVLAARK